MSKFNLDAIDKVAEYYSAKWTKQAELMLLVEGCGLALTEVAHTGQREPTSGVGLMNEGLF